MIIMDGMYKIAKDYHDEKISEFDLSFNWERIGKEYIGDELEKYDKKTD